MRQPGEPRVYGQWSGNPRGAVEDVTRCVERVWPNDGWVEHQCRRKRGHGPNGEYCKQHAKQFPPEVDKVVDLMEALKASLAKSKEAGHG